MLFSASTLGPSPLPESSLEVMMALSVSSSLGLGVPEEGGERSAGGGSVSGNRKAGGISIRLLLAAAFSLGCSPATGFFRVSGRALMGRSAVLGRLGAEDACGEFGSSVGGSVAGGGGGGGEVGLTSSS